MPQQDYTYRNDNASLQLNELIASRSGLPLKEWLPGHHYVYTIRLRAERIEMTGQVVEWGDIDEAVDVGLDTP